MSHGGIKFNLIVTVFQLNASSYGNEIKICTIAVQAISRGHIKKRIFLVNAVDSRILYTYECILWRVLYSYFMSSMAINVIKSIEILYQ